jgi:hypothetical protein
MGLRAHTLGLGLVLAASCGIAHSQTAWLLVRSKHFAIVRAQGQTVRDIVALRRGAAIYGESRRLVVVADDAWVHVVDKESATVASFQLASQPQFVGALTDDVSGPLMVVTEGHAFFPAMRLSWEALAPAPPNQLGGQYDIIQMSLTDGSLRSIPLPADCLYPLLAELGRELVVYTPNSDKAWVLDSATARFVRVQSSDDVAELRTEEAVGLRRARGTPHALVRYAIVPRAGAFRLSKLGVLNQTLDANLAKIGVPPEPIELGPAHDVLGLLPAESNGLSVIGVVRRQQGRVTFSYLDGYSLGVAWETDIAPGAIANSFYAARDGSAYYIDRKTGAVNRLSQKDGRSTSWRLQPGQSDAARILSIDLAR